jgi:hypothetical protein
MQFQLIKKIYASADTNAHPTIPFVPPGGDNTTPTPTPSTVVKGPHFGLNADITQFNIGDEGVVDITIDTDGQDIDEFKLTLNYDSSHIEIIDQVNIQSGTQIEYIDTHFIPFQNDVDSDVSGEGGSVGSIVVTAQAQNSQAASVSGRTIARIRFTVISTKTSEIEFNVEQTNLLINNVNIIDADALESFEISSEGLTVTPSTTTLTPTPKITKVPNTALSSNSVSLILIGLILVTSGYLLKRQVDSKLSKK